MNPAAASAPLVEARALVKRYRVGDQTVHAINDVSLSIARGDYVAIMGASGSGKSTFMNMIGCLDVPTSGDILIDGLSTRERDGDALAALRNAKIGFVFQQFNLLARTTALDNVAVPLLYAGRPRAEREQRARAALERMGLGSRMDHTPARLSGGQQQRVAIARALVNAPPLLLADEPTGALDSQTSEEIMGVFGELNRQGITIVIVTHEPDIAAHARRLILFRDGQVMDDRRQSGRGEGPDHG